MLIGTLGYISCAPTCTGPHFTNRVITEQKLTESTTDETTTETSTHATTSVDENSKNILN